MQRALTTVVAFSALLWVQAASAQVVLVEPGHTLNQIVDSGVPLDPSQVQLDVDQPVGNIESIGIDTATRDLYVQVIDAVGFPLSLTTSIYRVVPATGVVIPINVNTLFGINARGTDLHFDPITGLLVTQDQNTAPGESIATVNPVTGAVGSYSPAIAPSFSGSTFGMGFSAGAVGSDVPAGDIVFTGDVANSGIHSATFGVGSVTHVGAAIPGGGDDMVVQPDGDWIWVGDFMLPIVNFSPVPPHAGTLAAVPDIQTMFTNAGLPFACGSRATVCDLNGDVYISYSCFPGGAGIFRINESLTTATLVLTVGQPGAVEGLHDLILGPSTIPGSRRSVYFTVHDANNATEEVWEVTAPFCAPPVGAPAVSHWGLVIMSMLLAATGFVALRRRLVRTA